MALQYLQSGRYERQASDRPRSFGTALQSGSLQPPSRFVFWERPNFRLAFDSQSGRALARSLDGLVFWRLPSGARKPNPCTNFWIDWRKN